MSELGFEDLMMPTITFAARGNTYVHKDELQSWGWFWCQKNRCWLYEGGVSEDDLCVKAIKKLNGVRVTKHSDDLC